MTAILNVASRRRDPAITEMSDFSSIGPLAGGESETLG